MAQPDIVGMIDDRFRPIQESAIGAMHPYVTYFIVSDQTGMTLCGTDGLSRKRVQLDMMGRSYGQIDTLAGYFKGTHERPRLHGYAGTLGGVDVKACFVMDRQDLYEDGEAGENTGVHRVTMDLEIWHKE